MIIKEIKVRQINNKKLAHLMYTYLSESTECMCKKRKCLKEIFCAELLSTITDQTCTHVCNCLKLTFYKLVCGHN